MNYTYMPHIGMPFVSIFGLTILALSLASDHLDFLGMARGWTILAHSLLPRAKVGYKHIMG